MVTTQVFRGAVNNVVDSIFERTMVNRRTEGAVDHGADFMASGNVHCPFEIGNAQIRVGGTFRDNKARVWLDRRFERVVIATFYYRRFDAQPLQEGLTKLASAAVTVI